VATTFAGGDSFQIWSGGGVLHRRYVEVWGHRMVDDGVTAYFIVFSNSVTGTGIDTVRQALRLDVDDPKMFRANDGNQLEVAFQSIKNSILSDLWHLNGPGI